MGTTGMTQCDPRIGGGFKDICRRCHQFRDKLQVKGETTSANLNQSGQKSWRPQEIIRPGGRILARCAANNLPNPTDSGELFECVQLGRQIRRCQIAEYHLRNLPIGGLVGDLLNPVGFGKPICGANLNMHRTFETLSTGMTSELINQIITLNGCWVTKESVNAAGLKPWVMDS